MVPTLVILKIEGIKNFINNSMSMHLTKSSAKLRILSAIALRGLNIKSLLFRVTINTDSMNS